MSRPKLTVTGGDIATIKAALRKDEKFYQGVRLYAVLQMAEGKNARDLAPLYNTSFKSITNWVHRFNRGGVEALKDQPHSGRPSRLSIDQLAELEKIIHEQSPEQHGFNSGTWSGPIAIALVSKMFKVVYGKAQIYNLLHKMGLTHQKGKAYYPETDSVENKEKREALKKTPKP
jgi:transposase